MATLEQSLNQLPPECQARIQQMADDMMLDYKLQQIREELALSQ